MLHGAINNNKIGPALHDVVRDHMRKQEGDKVSPQLTARGRGQGEWASRGIGGRGEGGVSHSRQIHTYTAPSELPSHYQ